MNGATERAESSGPLEAIQLLVDGTLAGSPHELHPRSVRLEVPDIEVAVIPHAADHVVALVHPVAAMIGETPVPGLAFADDHPSWKCEGGLPPATEIIVGARSRNWTKSARTVPASILPGHRMINGTFKPES